MWAYDPIILGKWCICPEYDLRSGCYIEIKLVLRRSKLDDVVIDRDRIRTVSLGRRWGYRLIGKELLGEEMAVEMCPRIKTASNKEAIDGC